MTLQQYLRIPPFMYRMIARVKVRRKVYRPLSQKELIERTGLSKPLLSKLTIRDHWKGLRIEVIDAYITGCGYDPTNQHHALHYLKMALNNKKGLLGLRNLRQTQNLSLAQRAARSKQLKRLVKLLKIV